MAISLEKGQRIEIGLSKVSVGLGWDPNEGSGFDFDLDASAFMLGGNKKLPKDELELVIPTMEYKKDVEEYLQEFLDNGENANL